MNAAAQKAALRSAWPGWSIIHTTDTGRWWATHNPTKDPDTDRLVAHPVSEVDADTPEQLHAVLLKVAAGEKPDGLHRKPVQP